MEYQESVYMVQSAKSREMGVSPISFRKKRSTTLALCTAFRAGRTNNNFPKRPVRDGR